MTFHLKGIDQCIEVYFIITSTKLKQNCGFGGILIFEAHHCITVHKSTSISLSVVCQGLRLSKGLSCSPFNFTCVIRTQLSLPASFSTSFHSISEDGFGKATRLDLVMWSCHLSFLILIKKVCNAGGLR